MVDTKVYSPGVHKLLHHLTHLEKIVNNEVVAPIHVSVWPTLNCQLNCYYCCCKKEASTSQELSIEDFKEAVSVLSKYGTKAIEFSGGGEPLLWEHFNEAVNYIHERGIKLSLVTNGLCIDAKPKEILSKFSWIRISIQSAAYINKINYDYIPKDVKFTFSYIIGDKNFIKDIKATYDICKEKNIIARIAVARPSTQELEDAIREEVQKYGEPLFFSDKKSGKPDGCYMPWIRAAIDWRGMFLPCPSMQLNIEHEGLIPKDFPLCNIKDLEDWLHNNKPYDLGYRCSFCNCGKEHNDFIHNLLTGDKEDVDFV